VGASLLSGSWRTTQFRRFLNWIEKTRALRTAIVRLQLKSYQSNSTCLEPPIVNASAIVRLVCLGFALLVGAGFALAENGKEPEKAGGESTYYRPQPKKEVPWAATIDPAPSPAGGVITAWDSIAINSQARKTILPLLPGPFVALAPKPTKGQKDDGLMRVYDLRTGNPTGKPFKVASALGEHVALAGDGAYVAYRLAGKSNPHAIEVIDTATGEALRNIEAGHDKEWGFPLGFVGPGKLLTQTREVQNPDFSEKTEYKVWEVKTGQLVSEIAFDLVWAPSVVGLSPGGKYIVFQIGRTLLGHRLIIIELATGKVACDISLVGKDEVGGMSAGLVFSPDGKELAMLWHFVGRKKEGFGKVVVFDAATGKMLATHELADLAGVDLGTRGGLDAIQWVPDGSGWLLYGLVLMDRQTGKESGRLGGDKKLAHMRRFVDAGHVTTLKGGGDASVSLEAVKMGQR
jgi:hypothetical protein